MRASRGSERAPVLLALLLLSLAPALGAWESQLLPWNAGAGQYEEATVSFASRNWRLLDFSYSGYKLGAQPLATGVPCTVFNVSGSGDITAALQAAINSAQTAGGIVRIPAGTFTLSAPLYITGSNVSIEGAGSNATFINVPASYTQSDPRYEGLFTFGKAAAGWNKGWIDRGTVLTDVTAIVPEGQMYVDVADASGIAVNDWIVVRQYFWPALSNANSNSTWASYTGWPSPTTAGNRSFSFTYLRQVLSKAGNRLNLDAPIPWRLDPANNPVRVQQVPPTGGFAMKQNVGLAGLSISFADNYNDTSFSPARPAGAAVHFEGVRDGWIYDLVVRNFPRFAIQAESAARITVLDSAVYDCQDFGGDGYGYAYHWNESQQVLVRRSYAEMTRHAYICQHPLTNMMVLTGNSSREARLGDDSHHSFVHGYLFDDHRSYEGSGARTVERGSTSSNAYETAGSSVFWNFQGDGGRGGGADGGSIFMNPSFSGWGMVIGGPGGAYKVFDGNTAAGDLIPPAAGLQVGPTLQAAAEGSKDQNALYEGIGQAGLSPASLYQTQLLRRLGSFPADFAAGCSASFTRQAVAPSLYTGAGTLVYDSDHLGWVPQIGSGCDPASTAAGGTKTLQCWADSDAQNHTPGGAESAWATVNGTDYSILMDFTGTTQPRNTYNDLTFWAYSSVAGLQLRLYISQRQDGNYTDSNTGNTLISVPVANTWTQVTVPMSTFGAGATLFNKIQFRSYSTNAGATVYIDDIILTGGATPTPTATRTRTGTPSPTRTPTPFFSQTATATPSPSASPTRTRTASPSPSASATPSLTASPSPTASPSRTATPSPSLTPTRSATTTRSATSSYTLSPTPSESPTPTPSYTDVPPGSTETSSPTGTWSVTESPTLTVSASATQTPTNSPTSTASPSPSVTFSPTAVCPGGGFLGSSTITGITDVGGFIDGNRYYLPVPGTVTGVQFLVGSGSGLVRVGFYADTAGAPGALLTEGGPQGTQNGVNSIDVTPVDLVPGYYWIFVQTQGGPQLGYTNSGGQEYYQPYTFGAFPPTLSGGAYDVWRIALLAVICPLPTPTVTPTSTATESASPTDTPTLTDSPTPSFSASPSGTPSVSSSWTPSPAATATASPTRTASPSSTLTGSPTRSLTYTPVPFTPTFTATPSSTASPLPTATATPSSTATPPPTATPSGTPSATPPWTVTVSPTQTRTPPPTVLTSGTLRIVRAVPFPQPDPSELRVLLDGPCDDLVVRLYSPAYVLMAELHSGPQPAGWMRVKLPAGLPAGLCYADLSARLGARQSPAIAPLRLVRLR